MQRDRHFVPHTHHIVVVYGFDIQQLDSADV